MIFLFVGYPIILDSCILDCWLLCYGQTELIPFLYSVIGIQIVYVEYLHRNWYSKFRTTSAAPSPFLLVPTSLLLQDKCFIWFVFSWVIQWYWIHVFSLVGCCVVLIVCLTCQINFVIPFLFLRLISHFMGYPMMVVSCILLGWLLCYDQYLSHIQDFDFPGYFFDPNPIRARVKGPVWPVIHLVPAVIT